MNQPTEKFEVIEQETHLPAELIPKKSLSELLDRVNTGKDETQDEASITRKAGDGPVIRVMQIPVREILTLQAALNLARRHQAELSVYSPSDGTFTIQDAPNSPGHFVQRGELIAYVTDRSANTVRVVVPQADAEFVRHRTASVLVRSFDNVAQTHEARILREVPAATDELPSMTLSLQGGGKIGMDPRASGEGRALEKLFIFDLEVPSGNPANYIGGRVYVRFQHEAEPLATQWYRELRRVFLRKFSL